MISIRTETMNDCKQSYIDAGEIRIVVSKIRSEPTSIKSYGLDSQYTDAKQYAEALQLALTIAEKWDA